jgi:hypothetical protein
MVVPGAGRAARGEDVGEPVGLVGVPAAQQGARGPGGQGAAGGGQVAGDAEVHAVPVTGDRWPAGHDPFPVPPGPRPGVPVGSGRHPGIRGDQSLPGMRAVNLQDAGGGGDRERPRDGVGVAEAVFLAGEQDGTQAAQAAGGGNDTRAGPPGTIHARAGGPVPVAAHAALVLIGLGLGVAQHLGGAAQLGRRLPSRPLHDPLRDPVQARPPPTAPGGGRQPGGHRAQAGDQGRVVQRVGSRVAAPVASVLGDIGERRDDRQRIITVRGERRERLLVILARQFRLDRRGPAGAALREVSARPSARRAWIPRSLPSRSGEAAGRYGPTGHGAQRRRRDDG